GRIAHGPLLWGLSSKQRAPGQYVYISIHFRAHLKQKKSRKKRGVRRSEAVKPCRILDLRSAGNCLLLIYEINYVLDYYIDILLSIFSIFHWGFRVLFNRRRKREEEVLKETNIF